MKSPERGFLLVHMIHWTFFLILQSSVSHSCSCRPSNTNFRSCY